MGWRDEMATMEEGEKKTEDTNDDAEAAQLEERPVQTAPRAGPAPQLQFDNRNPTPTRTIPLPVPAPAVQAPVPAPIPVQAQHQPARRASDDGVPLWLDRAIVVLVVLLVALVLKIIFAV